MKSMMAVHVVHSLSRLLFLLFLTVQATASPPLQSSPDVAIDGIEGSTAPRSEGLVGDIIHNSRDYELSTTIAPLPMCWKRVVAILSEVIDFDTHASDFCTSMDPFMMDLLAFELARCQTSKSSTPFIEDSDEMLVGFCSGGRLEDQSQLDRCIRRLDQNSFNIHMQFTMHIQQLCVRFTEELVAARKEQVGTSIYGRSFIAFPLCCIRTLTYFGIVHCWFIVVMQAALVLAKSSIAVGKQLNELMKKNDELIKKVEEQQELVQGFNDALEDIRIELSSTARNFRPVALVAGFISQWYLWLMSSLYFLVALNAVWILTINKTSRWLRLVLLNVVLLEALLEMMSHWALSSGNIEMDDHSKKVALWRKGCLMIIILIFTLGSMVSFLSGSKADIVHSHQDSSAFSLLSSDVQEDLALALSTRFLTPRGNDARAVSIPEYQRNATRFSLYRLLLNASLVLTPVCAYKYALPWAEYCFYEYALPWAVYCFDEYTLPLAVYCFDVFIISSIAGIRHVFCEYWACSRICSIAFIFAATFYRYTALRRSLRGQFTEGVIEKASIVREEVLKHLAAAERPVYALALRDEIALEFYPRAPKERYEYFNRHVWRAVELDIRANNGIIKRKLDTTDPNKPPLEHWEMMRDVKHRRLNMG